MSAALRKGFIIGCEVAELLGCCSATQEPSNSGTLPTVIHHAREGASQIVAVVLIRGVRGVRFDIDDHVERALVDLQRLALTPVDFTSPALETVANVGFPELLRRGDADSRLRQAVRGEEENDVAGNDLLALFVDSKKLGALRQPRDDTRVSENPFPSALSAVTNRL